MTGPLIVRAERTCSACPSQWNAWDDAGGYWYLRYRYSHGTASRYAEGEDWFQVAWAPEPLAELSFDTADEYGPLDGSISLAEFAGRCGLRLAPELFPDALEGYPLIEGPQ